MPFRQNGRSQWIVKATHAGRVLRFSTGTPVLATAERYEGVLRALARYDHAEVLEALQRKEVTLSQVARWWETEGDAKIIGALRRHRQEREVGRLLRPAVEQWVAERQGLKRPTAVTLARYAACLMRAIPEGMTAGQLTREHVIRVLAKGPNARKMYVALTIWCAWARRGSILSHDPLSGVPVPPPGEARGRWLSQERLAELLREVAPKYRDAVLLAYGTGIEREVLVTLSPRDVNLRDRTILARGTKTHARERTVRVAEFAWPAVERLMEARSRKRTLLPPMTGWALSKAHRKAADAIGETGLRLHDARHTYAVRLAKAGTPPQVIADQLGNSVEMVVKVYAKHSPDLSAKNHWEAKAAASGW